MSFNLNDLLHNIHRFYAEDTWKEYLKADKLNDAINLLSERKARNEDIDLSDCLQLCDKVELITILLHCYMSVCLLFL